MTDKPYDDQNPDDEQHDFFDFLIEEENADGVPGFVATRDELIELCRQKEQIPYVELDPAVVKLCRVISEFPGIMTLGSCQATSMGTAAKMNHGRYCSVQHLTSRERISFHRIPDISDQRLTHVLGKRL
jgi:hypothetical protein